MPVYIMEGIHRLWLRSELRIFRIHLIGILSLFIVCVITVASYAETLTEKGAVLRALSHNDDIVLTRLGVAKDSLSLQMARTVWFPELDLKAQADPYLLDTAVYENTPAGTTSTPGRSSGRRNEFSAGAELTQHLPGGATVSTGISAGGSFDGEDTYENTFDVSLSQPLLKNAWYHDPNRYSVRMARHEYAISTLQYKKDIISQISDIRSLYWQLYKQAVLVREYEKDAAVARQQQEAARARFGVGDATVLDTLSATLSYLNAVSTVRHARNEASSARRDLAYALGMGFDSVAVDTAGAVSLDSLPVPERFVERARAFDPQLAIFKTMKKRLREDVAKTRNALLPSVDVRASYRMSRAGHTPLVPDSMVGHNAALSLIFTYAIPQKTTRIEAARSRLSLTENETQRRARERNIEKRIHALRDAWEYERESLRISGKKVVLALRKRDATLVAYEHGTASRLELLQARKEYVQASVAHINRKITMKQVEISVDELTGRVTGKFGVTLK